MTDDLCNNDYLQHLLKECGSKPVYVYFYHKGKVPVYQMIIIKQYRTEMHLSSSESSEHQVLN